ncbi:MAG: DUF5317 domain-containing protein [Actinomycetota bacterium]
MILGLVVACIAATVAIFRGGSLVRLAETRVSGIVLLVVAVAVQVAAVTISSAQDLGETTVALIFLFVNALVAAFIYQNRRLPGIWVLAGGLLLNTLVIAANGGMPMAQTAANIAGFGDDLDQIDVEHELMTPATRLKALGDVIPVPRAQLVVSLGDVLLALGIGRFVFVRALKPGSATATPPPFPQVPLPREGRG